MKADVESSFEDHVFTVRFRVGASPFNRKDTCFEEFLVRILAADIKPVKADFVEFLHDEIMAGENVFFGEARVEDESIVLCHVSVT